MTYLAVAAVGLLVGGFIGYLFGLRDGRLEERLARMKPRRKSA